ncbi:MAG: helix-turn-helix domain-containing protein [Rhodospirillales bacterium]|nr:helix-turn-helix domain-containing protein [Rhodospirillales bacterium]
MQASIQTPQAKARHALPTATPAGPATPEPLDLLEQFGATLRFGRDHEIHAEGDAAEFCYRVVSGCVRTVRLLEDGRRQVGEFLLAGEVFGLDELDTHSFAAETVTETVLRRYPRRMVEALAESRPALARRLRQLALEHLRVTQERTLLLGRKTATERLASFVLEFDRRMPASGRGLLDLPMSRTDIADHLGLTVETVCRVLAALKREGTIQVSRTGLQLLDRTTLLDLACETRH